MCVSSVRRATYERLVSLQNGSLSSVMEELLTADPMQPLLTPPHLRAMDRRLTHVLQHIQLCSDNATPGHVLQD